MGSLDNKSCTDSLYLYRDLSNGKGRAADGVSGVDFISPGGRLE